MTAYIDIPYKQDHPLHRFDIYTGVGHVTAPLVCFVHGGAWRSEDKADHAHLARKLASLSACSVAVPNYRLTSSHPSGVRHPAHAEDILHFLSFLLTWPGPDSIPLYDPQRLFLIGHSCGAHILSSIFLNSSSVSPSLTPTNTLLSAVRGIIMSEGIYDLDLLLSTFPKYKEWFIAPTFGLLDSYAKFSTSKFPLWNTHIRWLVIHSSGDSLVDIHQSQIMYEHLRSLHEAHPVHVSRNVQLMGEHNEILRADEYVRIVREFVERNK